MALLQKNKKNTGVDENQKNTKVKNSNGGDKAGTLLQSALPSLLIAILIMLGVTGGTYYVVESVEKDQHEAVAKVYQQHYLETLDAYLRAHEDIVMALSDERLLPYIAESTEANSLTAHYPGAVYARAVSVLIDPALPNGLSFAHQDMVLRVASGKKVTPEISFYEKEQVVTFARPIREDGKIAGVLLLSMSFKPLATALAGFAADAGALELVQRNDAEKATIISTGSGLDVESPIIASPSLNQGWEVHFSPVRTLGRDNPVPVLILGMGVLASLLCGGLRLVMLLLINKRLLADASALDNFCENYFRYGTRSRPKMNFQACATVLAKYISEKGSITVDGISLTVNAIDGATFSLNIVPHTVQETNVGQWQTGSVVNLEVDLLARYLERLIMGDKAAQPTAKADISLEFLAQHGFMR